MEVRKVGAMRIIDEEIVLSAADGFNEAAFTGNWLGALSALARATDSRIGQLVGFGSPQAAQFNWVTELGLDYLEEFLALDGANPEVNPFVRAASMTTPLQTVSSAEILTPQELKRNYFIAVHSKRHDLQHICLTPLIKDHQLEVGLAVIRTANQGEIKSQQRAAFAAIAPHVRTAVRTQIALENQGAALMAGALEAISLTAFICDRQGTVRAMTPFAESLVSNGNLLKLKRNSLNATTSVETRTLADAIMRATGGLTTLEIPASSTILVRDKLAQPSVVQILALPQRYFSFGFEPRALVIVRTKQPNDDSARILMTTVYGLTSAEVDISIRLVDGKSPEQIAIERNASLGTVRAQIRSIYDKCGVNRFSEFAAKLNQLR